MTDDRTDRTDRTDRPPDVDELLRLAARRLRDRRLALEPHVQRASRERRRLLVCLLGVAVDLAVLAYRVHRYRTTSSTQRDDRS